MARTVPDVQVNKLPSGITSATTPPITASLTSDSTTTAELNKAAFTHGTVTNISGSSVVVTYYGARKPGAFACPLYDEDGVAVTQTIVSPAIQELPAAVAGVPVLIPVSTAATATLYFVFAR